MSKPNIALDYIRADGHIEVIIINENGVVSRNISGGQRSYKEPKMDEVKISLCMGKKNGVDMFQAIGEITTDNGELAYHAINEILEQSKEIYEHIIENAKANRKI